MFHSTGFSDTENFVFTLGFYVFQDWIQYEEITDTEETCKSKYHTKIHS